MGTKKKKNSHFEPNFSRILRAQENAIATSSRDISPSAMPLPMDDKYNQNQLIHVQSGIMLSTYKDSHQTGSRLKQHEI